MIIDDKEYKVFEIDEDLIGLSKSQDLKLNVENELKSGNKLIAFNLSKLDSINSAGLGILISVLNKIKTSDGSLKLLNINDRILNIFKITKLDLIFEIKN